MRASSVSPLQNPFRLDKKAKGDLSCEKPPSLSDFRRSDSGPDHNVMLSRTCPEVASLSLHFPSASVTTLAVRTSLAYRRTSGFPSARFEFRCRSSSITLVCSLLLEDHSSGEMNSTPEAARIKDFRRLFCCGNRGLRWKMWKNFCHAYDPTRLSPNLIETRCNLPELFRMARPCGLIASKLRNLWITSMSLFWEQAQPG